MSASTTAPSQFIDPHLANGRPAHVNLAWKIGDLVRGVSNELGVKLVELAITAKDIRERGVCPLHADDERVELYYKQKNQMSA